MTEQPHDHSDQGDPTDGEMVVALTQVDVIIEKYIRASIGDHQYEAYNARTSLSHELSESMGEEERKAFGRPIDHVEKQAAKLMKQMIDEGKDPEEAKRQADKIAVDEWLADKSPEGDKNYIEAYSEITDELEASIEDSLKLTQKYPDIEVSSVDEGQLSLVVERRIESKGEEVKTIYLQVILVVDGASIATHAFYAVYPRNLVKGGSGKPERIDIDPADYDNLIGGVGIEVLKKDALKALKVAIAQS